MDEFRLYHAHYEDYIEKRMEVGSIIPMGMIKRLVDVTILPFGKIEVVEFHKLNDALLFIGGGMSFKFVEITSTDGSEFLLYISEICFVRRKGFAVRHLYHFGENWNLFLNSWDHIYAQGRNETPNTRFRMSSYNTPRFDSLAILMYTMLRTKHSDLEQEYYKNYAQFQVG